MFAHLGQCNMMDTVVSCCPFNVQFSINSTLVYCIVRVLPVQHTVGHSATPKIATSCLTHIPLLYIRIYLATEGCSKGRTHSIATNINNKIILLAAKLEPRSIAARRHYRTTCTGVSQKYLECYATMKKEVGK